MCSAKEACWCNHRNWTAELKHRRSFRDYRHTAVALVKTNCTISNSLWKMGGGGNRKKEEDNDGDAGGGSGGGSDEDEDEDKKSKRNQREEVLVNINTTSPSLPS